MVLMMRFLFKPSTMILLGANLVPLIGVIAWGWDAFVLSGHVLLCLRDSGVPIGSGTSKKDLRLAQAQFNAWKAESGLPITHISRTCALSIGENYPVERLKEIMQL